LNQLIVFIYINNTRRVVPENGDRNVEDESNRK